MTKTEQNRVLTLRLKVMREAGAVPRNVAQTCRISSPISTDAAGWRLSLCAPITPTKSSA
jgi:hypothetical protein